MAKSSKFIIEIKTDNSAYEQDYYSEVIANLKAVIEEIDSTNLNGFIRDTNGNRVGRFYVREDLF
jgi:hypothetical protein